MTAKSFHLRRLTALLILGLVTGFTPHQAHAQETLYNRNLYTSLSVATTAMVSLAFLMYNLSEEEADTMFLSTTCSAELLELSTTSSEGMAAATLHVTMHAAELGMDISLGSGEHLNELLLILGAPHLITDQHFLTEHLDAARLLPLLLSHQHPDADAFLHALLRHNNS